MSITVAGGDARPHLYEVGKPHTGGVEVPREINVTALADALNSQLNGAPLTDEVTVFYALIAGAVGHGIELAEQMASVS